MQTLYVKTHKTLGNPTHYEVVEHNGRKFRIYYHYDGCHCRGFNSDCCVSVMTENGDFSYLADNWQLGYHPNWTSESTIPEVVALFKDYIMKIY